MVCIAFALVGCVVKAERANSEERAQGAGAVASRFEHGSGVPGFDFQSPFVCPPARLVGRDRLLAAVAGPNVGGTLRGQAVRVGQAKRRIPGGKGRSLVSPGTERSAGCISRCPRWISGGFTRTVIGWTRRLRSCVTCEPDVGSSAVMTVHLRRPVWHPQPSEDRPRALAIGLSRLCRHLDHTSGQLCELGEAHSCGVRPPSPAGESIGMPLGLRVWIGRSFVAAVVSGRSGRIVAAGWEPPSVPDLRLGISAIRKSRSTICGCSVDVQLPRSGTGIGGARWNCRLEVY